MRGKEIRREFLEFFRRHGHEVVDSSPLVPADDPTLLFVNAGMVQFKDVFLGRRTVPYRRAVTSQRCLRVGGKHNDLEHVGLTRRHNTMFEMLGNFSFGDYFREGAIGFAWEFLVEVAGLDPGVLWVTIHHSDDEAGDLWPRLTGVPAGRIVALGDKDNFWSMGETGPCGPCSEIIMDRGGDLACGPGCALGECDCDRWLELWNLVFMQYDRDASGTLTPLPAPSIDTGMSLERMASVLQEVEGNFETDLFRPIIAVVEEMTACRYDPGPRGFPFRVIADHARACSFMIADGILPRNEGRGYVLRRVLRRAVRLGRTLGLEESFLHRLVPVTLDVLKEAYPAAVERSDFIAQVVRSEEERFLSTLEHGLEQLERVIASARAEGRGALTGREAFLLYDTFGFPPDLTEDVAREAGMTVDRSGFEEAMQAQRDRAREAGLSGGGDALELDAAGCEQEFCGYDELEATALVVATAPAEDGTAVALDRTPFYTEAGGQVSDTGWLEGPAGRGAVTGCGRAGDLTYLVVDGPAPEPGQRVTAVVDGGRRQSVARSHTATHLLHWALRRVLGDHVTQAGSLVAPDRLRFDFTHFRPVDPGELEQIESAVNARIMEDLCVRAEVMSLDRAVERGALALFGEKYGEEVRVIEVDGVCLELCGGTHVRRTGEVGPFMVTGESSVGSGVRRIEALVGRAALEHARDQSRTLADIARALRCDPADVPGRVQDMMARRRDRDREAARDQKEAAVRAAREIASSAVDMSGVKVARATVEGDAEQLRVVADIVRDLLGSGVVVLGSRAGERALLLVAATRDAVSAGVHAGRAVGVAARQVGGGGGGRPDLAQAGGRDPGGMEHALQAAVDEIQKQVEGGS